MTKADKFYESVSATDDDDGEGKTVTSSLLEMKELNGPHFEGKRKTCGLSVTICAALKQCFRSTIGMGTSHRLS